MRTVITSGCFDCLHEGHISFLEKSKALGDWLIVLLNTDEYCRRVKGEGRPFQDFNSRRDALMNLECVDDVLRLDKENACMWLAKEYPRRAYMNTWRFTKGIEYAQQNIVERLMCDNLGIALVFIDSGSPLHSSYFNLLQ